MRSVDSLARGWGAVTGTFAGPGDLPVPGLRPGETGQRRPPNPPGGGRARLQPQQPLLMQLPVPLPPPLAGRQPGVLLAEALRVARLLRRLQRLPPVLHPTRAQGRLGPNMLGGGGGQRTFGYPESHAGFCRGSGWAAMPLQRESLTQAHIL